MNTDADTRYPHLDLGELISGAAGHPVDDRAARHLASCEHCQLEAKRWNLVAEGVRGLAATAPEAAQPGWPQRTRRRVRTPWRRALLVTGSVAAAIVLVVGIGAALGFVHVHLSGSHAEPTLTAVTGCTQLQLADGTLEQVNGSSLVVRTSGGRTVTVTTTPSTFVSMSGAPVSEITDGAAVVVRSTRADGTIRAAIVTVGQPFSVVNPPGFVSVGGTVADATGAGFTLVTSSGTRVPVTTSDATLVVVPHASPAQLQTGTRIFALGDPGPAGTLSARAVAAVSQLRSGAHISVSVKDCSSGSIVEALGALSTTPASVG